MESKHGSEPTGAVKTSLLVGSILHDYDKRVLNLGSEGDLRDNGIIFIFYSRISIDWTGSTFCTSR